MADQQGAPLCGLLLAGGEARRMGRDKGTVSYYGEPQARRCWNLLHALCAEAFVSVRPDQQVTPLYSALPLIVDSGKVRGPAAGLSAAFEHNPETAWLLLAVDMPLLDRAVLEALIRARDLQTIATAFRHPDNTPEPLCAIWEPAARVPLQESIRQGNASLRRLLEVSPVRFLEPSDPAVLTSVDSVEEYRRIRARLAAAASRSSGAERR